MLRIIQTQSAGGAKSYYSRSDYLSEGQELTGVWHGKGASMLGLSGEVQKQDFDRMCDNLHPSSGETLTQRQRINRTIGYDFNFHVPKGVSLAYELTGDKGIFEAFQDAVNQTMQEIEVDAATRVRKHGGDLDRQVGNLAWAQFVHKTARPVDGIPDPHLHAHCFVFNAVFDENEQAWKAGQFRDIKRDARYFEAAYHVRLANNLKDLGYDIHREGKTWDLAGISKDLSRKFSRRTEQIEALAEKKGLNDQDKSDLGALSREGKNSDLNMHQLREIWRERLNGDEIVALDNLKSQPDIRFIENDKTANAKAMSHAISHCFERSSVVPKRVLLAEALRYGVGQVEVEAIHDQLKQQHVITKHKAGRQYTTTKQVLYEEKAMVKFVESGKQQCQTLNRDWKLRRDWLNNDQTNAIHQILGSRDRVTVLRGSAGTGKTTLMTETVEAIEAGGKQVFTFAPSAEASRGVLASEGFNATTVADLLLSKNLQAETAHQVIWVDEAGLLSSKQLKAVMDIAERNEARLILSGDWRQHTSPERGCPMRMLEEESVIQPIRLHEIQRQKGDYKRAVSYLADGITELGLEELEKLGWVHEIEDDSQRLTTVANEYANYVCGGHSALVVVPTHHEGQQVTQSIRQKFQELGKIDSTEHEFKRLVNRRLTEAERADPAMIEADDVLVFHQNVPGIKRGSKVKASDALLNNIQSKADRFNVFREETLSLAQGDRIRITHGGKTIDGKHRLDNGNLFTIKRFDAQGNIVLNNDWVIDKDFGHIALGYVSTSHASQGKTVDRVFLVESSQSFPAAGREQFYVSVSRGRHQATIYTDNLTEFRDAVSRDDQSMSATQLMESDDFEKSRERSLKLQRELSVVAAREQEREAEHVRS